ncbi:Conserved_hypothetical protein [Hexamita inflata]|uniref:Uncharacterized protein n=1 Tax=Hexamita inflata TaxID=28002 RepID=A0ABP1LLK7_9EUKA
MVNLQINQTDIQQFEDSFKQAVEQRTKQSYATMLETYVAYKNLNEFSRQHFWEFIANQTGLQRERVYKFFRFTWTRQFYACLDDHRDSIKALVCQILDQLNEQKQTAIYSKVWNKVWPVYQDYDLHYDGTDQFVRNCVNWYFNRVDNGLPIIIQSNSKSSAQSIKMVQQKEKITTVVQKDKQQVKQDQVKRQQKKKVETLNDNYNYFGKVFDEEYNFKYTEFENDTVCESTEIQWQDDEYDEIVELRFNIDIGWEDL